MVHNSNRKKPIRTHAESRGVNYTQAATEMSTEPSSHSDQLLPVETRWFNRTDTWIDRVGIEHQIDDMTYEQLMNAMVHLVTRVRLIHFIEVKRGPVGTSIPLHPYYRYELPLDFTPEFAAAPQEVALLWLNATPVYGALNRAINARMKTALSGSTSDGKRLPDDIRGKLKRSILRGSPEATQG